MGKIKPEYRKLADSQIWHFNPQCYWWPSTRNELRRMVSFLVDPLATHERPDVGLCEECASKLQAEIAHRHQVARLLQEAVK